MVALLLNTFHRKLHGIKQRSPPHIAPQITWAVGKPGKGGGGTTFQLKPALFSFSMLRLPRSIEMEMHSNGGQVVRGFTLEENF